MWGLIFQCFARMTWYEANTKIDKRFDKLVFNNKEFVEDEGICTLPLQGCYWRHYTILIILYKLFGEIMTVTGIFYIGQPLYLLERDWGLLPGLPKVLWI